MGLDLPSSDHGLRTRSLSSEGTASTLKRILYTALNKTCRGSYGVFCVDLTRVYNAERSCHSIPCSFRYLRNQLVDDTCSLKQQKVDTPSFTALPLLPELSTPTTISPSLDWKERPYRCHAEVLPYRSSGHCVLRRHEGFTALQCSIFRTAATCTLRVLEEPGAISPRQQSFHKLRRSSLQKASMSHPAGRNGVRLTLSSPKYTDRSAFLCTGRRSVLWSSRLRQALRTFHNAPLPKPRHPSNHWFPLRRPAHPPGQVHRVRPSPLDHERKYRVCGPVPPAAPQGSLSRRNRL